jgi:hypothetical protein
VTEVQEDGFTLVASGDLAGRGIWTYVQDGPDVLIKYDWKILAEKPLLRNFSFIMKPIFDVNHRWAMAKGEESLTLKLARRHARSEAAQALVPAPPAATRVPVAPLVLGLLAIAAVVWLVTRRGRLQARRTWRCWISK